MHFLKFNLYIISLKPAFETLEHLLSYGHTHNSLFLEFHASNILNFFDGIGGQ